MKKKKKNTSADEAPFCGVTNEITVQRENKGVEGANKLFLTDFFSLLLIWVGEKGKGKEKEGRKRREKKRRMRKKTSSKAVGSRVVVLGSSSIPSFAQLLTSSTTGYTSSLKKKYK